MSYPELFMRGVVVYEDIERNVYEFVHIEHGCIYECHKDVPEDVYVRDVKAALELFKTFE